MADDGNPFLLLALVCVFPSSHECGGLIGRGLLGGGLIGVRRVMGVFREHGDGVTATEFCLTLVFLSFFPECH